MAPRFTTLASLESIARNVGSVSLSAEAPLGRNMMEVERTGSNVRWCQEGGALIIPLKALSALEIICVENGGERFVALALTFNSGGEALRYKMVTSHASEAGWLNKSAERIGGLLEFASHARAFAVMRSNYQLVPTRTGEAPVLAAQLSR